MEHILRELDALTEHIVVTTQKGSLLLTLNNPPANTWQLSTLEGLHQFINKLAQHGVTCPLIVTGHGEKFFSAGADLKSFHQTKDRDVRQMAEAFGRAFQSLSEYPGLTIAAINGIAMGGGLEVGLACDVRICVENALLALPETSVGLLPCGLGTQLLPALVGSGWASRIILCGERLSASQALQIGLVQEVVASNVLLDCALTLAERAQQQSPAALRAAKSLIYLHRPRSLTIGQNAEREAFMRLFTSGDAQEGVRAFVEKRKPNWKS